MPIEKDTSNAPRAAKSSALIQGGTGPQSREGLISQEGVWGFRSKTMPAGGLIGRVESRSQPQKEQLQISSNHTTKDMPGHRVQHERGRSAFANHPQHDG